MLFSTIVFLSGGIIGTFHHLYFTGTPTAILALGATFSALEVVPLVLMGFEGYGNFKISQSKEWVTGVQMADLVFPFGCFLESCGGRYFRFPHQSADCLILHAGIEHNTGSRTYSAVRCLRNAWDRVDAFRLEKHGIRKVMEREMDQICILVHQYRACADGSDQRIAGWPGANLGKCESMACGMPVQLNSCRIPPLHIFRWLRVIGDTIFAVGALALAWFIFGLKGGWSIEKK